MPNNDYANEPNQSRSEDIIQSILDNTEYDEPARSRIEYLLVELKNAIEGGGGGGGVTSYSPLTEKPKIDNHTLQAGNNSSSDLGLQTKLTFDSAPTENSTNPVTSGGVYTALGTKANSADVYNKSAVDTALTAKADKSTTYTKTEVDTALSSKQNTISDLSTIRSGAALGATAVQPVSGKGLSTNDYTNDEKSKLAGIEAQANKTTVDSALSGTSTNPVQNKVVKAALDGKQATLTTAQLAAVNSGIDSAKVAQIETNKNNISMLTQYGGGKNKFQTPSIDTTNSGINVKTLSDGQLKVTSAGTNTSAVYIDLETNIGSKYVGYTLSGGSSNTGVYISNSGGGVACSVRGDEVLIPSNATNKLFLTINANTPAFEETIHVMIRESGDSTYQQYALSNAELTAKEQTNENNILKIHNPADVYFSETAPTGTIPMQSYWISSTGVHVYGDDVYGATLEQGSFETFSGAEITANNRVRTTFDSQAPMGTYTVSADGADDVVIYAYTSNSTSSWSSADSVTSWQPLPYTFTTAQNLYLRFAFRHNDNTAIAPSDVSNVKVIAHKWTE